jgi:hypothetical protein
MEAAGVSGCRYLVTNQEFSNMNRKSITFIASALSVAALAPAVAQAADLELGGSPQMRLIDARHANLSFAADRLPKKADGSIDARIRFAGGQRVTNLKATGTHGDDITYTARVTSRRALRVGAKYTVSFTFPGEDAVVRKVKLHPKR